MFIAFVLIAIGLIMLLKNLGFITAAVWDVVWPVALVALGLSMLLRRTAAYHMPWCKCDICETRSRQN